jgi:hypothetical protein
LHQSIATPSLLEEGIVRADVPFRRAESKYSVEQVEQKGK